MNNIPRICKWIICMNVISEEDCRCLTQTNEMWCKVRLMMSRTGTTLDTQQILMDGVTSLIASVRQRSSAHMMTEERESGSLCPRGSLALPASVLYLFVLFRWSLWQHHLGLPWRQCYSHSTSDLLYHCGQSVWWRSVLNSEDSCFENERRSNRCQTHHRSLTHGSTCSFSEESLVSSHWEPIIIKSKHSSEFIKCLESDCRFIYIPVSLCCDQYKWLFELIRFLSRLFQWRATGSQWCASTMWTHSDSETCKSRMIIKSFNNNICKNLCILFLHEINISFSPVL